MLYPVHVPGAKFSGGDLHFSQGDGEITFCGAIEMGGFIDFGVELIKGGMEKDGVTTDPIFMPGNVEPRYSEFISFCGVSVERDENRQEHPNALPTTLMPSTRERPLSGRALRVVAIRRNAYDADQR